MKTKTFKTETYGRLMAIAASIQTGTNADTLALIDELIEFKTAEKKKNGFPSPCRPISPSTGHWTSGSSRSWQRT